MTNLFSFTCRCSGTGGSIRSEIQLTLSGFLLWSSSFRSRNFLGANDATSMIRHQEFRTANRLTVLWRKFWRQLASLEVIYRYQGSHPNHRQTLKTVLAIYFNKQCKTDQRLFLFLSRIFGRSFAFASFTLFGRFFLGINHTEVVIGIVGWMDLFSFPFTLPLWTFGFIVF